VNLIRITRIWAAVLAGPALLASVVTAAGATSTFDVSTEIASACTVTDAGPADLTPAYTPSTDTSTGSETVLNTFCNGSNPTVTFTDAFDSNNNLFEMLSGANPLFFQISNGASCSGIPGDNPISESVAQNLVGGTSSYDICAAVITGAPNTTAPAGSYTDVVSYNITP